MKKILLLLLVALSACNCPTPPPAPTPTTSLRIVNETTDSVVVWVTLGATPGCLQNVSLIPYVTGSLGSLVGYFTLAAGDSTPDYAPANMGFNGNLTFGGQPINCPTPQFPDGVNLFEFIVNNFFQAGSPQETVDISCVAGVNASIQCILSGGNPWNASPLYPNVDIIFNRYKFGNSGLPGVYPYGCDDCTASVSPPDCAKNDKDKQLQPICNVQRNAISGDGGLVRVSYKGTPGIPALK